MKSYNDQREGSIAIIGMAGRFPGAGNIDEFWHNMENGIESISFFSQNELIAEGVPLLRVTDPNYVRAAPILKGVDLFDSQFFDYTPTEAESMDPAQRIFLQVAWEALEHAGHGGDSQGDPIGVFAGSGGVMNSYLMSHTHIRKDLIGATAGIEHLGNDKDYLCTRVSYKLNLKGPSLTIQTACSTSLVAVHIACQSLLSMECDMALAGGVNIRMPHKAGYMIDECPMHSPDGHCRPFDAEAKGTVFGSGAGVVVLKSLARAVADGDLIHGVIRGSAVTNDGSSKLSYWAASADGIANTLSEALAVAEVTPESVEYVEAHGTGTELGDPVEVQALTKVFRQDTNEQSFCALGSLKSNIGHLESASGVASLIKAVLALKHQSIPPTLHFSKPNPRIDLDDSPFYINSEKQKWETTQPFRRAIVNNLGIGGTNASVVLEAPPVVGKAEENPFCQILAFSAKTESALKRLASRFVHHLEIHKGYFGDICYTANTGRTHFNYRMALTATNAVEARSELAQFNAKGHETSWSPSQPDILFIFTDQGHPNADLGKQLYRNFPVFRDALDIFNKVRTSNITEPLFDPRHVKDPKHPFLNFAANERPALFALEYALAKLWISWGIKPDMIMGTGIGKYAAACIAGVFSPEDGMKLIAEPLGHEQTLSEVVFSPPGLNLISSHTGKTVTDGITNLENWKDYIGEPDAFSDGKPELDTMTNLLLELGPGQALSPKGRKWSAKNNIISFSNPFIGVDEVKQQLEMVKELYLHGLPINWSGIYQGKDCRRVVLPTYPFAKTSYWKPVSQELVDNNNDPVTASAKPESYGPMVSEAVTKHGSNCEMTGATEPSFSLLQEKTLHRLKILLEKITKFPAAMIDSETLLESYGIESFMINQLNQELAVNFSQLPKTLFYEHATLAELAEYMVASHTQECRLWTGLDGVDVSSSPLRGSSLSIRSHSVFNLPTPGSGLDNNRFMEKAGAFSEPIAIIGMAGRFPQASSTDAYWQNLKSGKDSIIEIPSDRWPLEKFFNSDRQEAVRQGKSYNKWGGFIEEFADFDALFFRIPPREAITMDPQERLFMEVCWHTFEEAGYNKAEIEKRHGCRVGVFAGITKTGFDLYGPDLWKMGERIHPNTSFGSVANRLSYFLNLNGPSMPIDTMCSSSLTAVHEACEHLHRGECEMAIAGGVNLYLHPSNYALLCEKQMLSTDGKCRSFGQGGTGFVPGEGAGAVLLKSLSRAIADHDNIHAVIRSSAINHGGETNGYFVPNPKAQGELINDALNKAGVNARSVSYIEAHGTGTELGDPIEISGLDQAFKKHTQENGFCAIGSVKSNIGHLEAAAGIAGMIKIVLQMKHQKLVASIHATDLNPNITFDQTPFVVQQSLTDWQRPQLETDEGLIELPRIAGLSSFGAGGANAHVVMEEYVSKPEERRTKVKEEQTYLIVLSAKDENRLRKIVENLYQFICKFSTFNLIDLAYTLQVGREALDERAALIVTSEKDLTGKLERIIHGEQAIEGLFRGNKKEDQEALLSFKSDPDWKVTTDSWFAKKKYEKIMEMWVTGLFVDWHLLYPHSRPNRISLPTYPFKGKTFWFKALSSLDGEKQSVSSKAVGAQSFSNSAGHVEHKFSVDLNSRDFFLRDHVIKGESILPGVVFLEIVRAAAEKIWGDVSSSGKEIKLKNVVWPRPLVVKNEDMQVDVSFCLENEVKASFAIHMQSSSTSRLHCQGLIELLLEPDGQAAGHQKVDFAPLDLEALKAICNLDQLSSSQCYAAFQDKGFSYGQGYRGIDTVYMGDGQALVKLGLPEKCKDRQEQFLLHPTCMDAALQACSLLSFTGDTFNLDRVHEVMPFAMRELVIHPGGTFPMWVWAQTVSEDSGVQNGKFDIDLSDQFGKPWCSIRGFSFRPIARNIQQSKGAATQQFLLLKQDWREKLVLQISHQLDYSQYIVLLCQAEQSLANDIMAQNNAVQCKILESANASGVSSIENNFQDLAMGVFTEIQALLRSRPRKGVLLQVLAPLKNRDQFCSSLTGLIKTARIENPKLTAQLICLDADSDDINDADSIYAKLLENCHCPEDIHVRYQDGRRLVAEYIEIEQIQNETSLPWKEQGTYLITGGAGGLGLIFLEEIAHQTDSVNLIITGRSKLDSEREKRIEHLKTLGANVQYQQIDVTMSEAVDDLAQGIMRRYGRLDGIIHGAGIIQDNFIIKKTEDEMRAVLAPKLAGLVNLDRSTRELKLDFFVTFSSLSGALGNAGQADYAVANAFMDEYAGYRNQLVAQNKRFGHTLSIGWPLWKDGGMEVDDQTQKMMKNSTGMVAMESTVGIAAFYHALAAEETSVVVISGDLARIRETMFEDRKMYGSKPGLKVNHECSQDADSRLYHIENILKQNVSEVLGVDMSDVDVRAEFTEYGFDSITFTELANYLNSNYSLELIPTIFFEYPTLKRFASYLQGEHPDRFGTINSGEALGELNEPSQREEFYKAPSGKPLPFAIHPKRPDGLNGNVQSNNTIHHSMATSAEIAESSTTQKTGHQDIAIIGMSGAFPMAQDIESLWQNLLQGKESVREIPKERWDWREYYGDPATQTNKTQVKWGGFIDGIAEFDPIFFGITPSEAELMDPQQRLLMTHAYRAIEDAGYAPQSLSGSDTAVFIGTDNSGYSDLIAKANVAIESYSSTGNISSVGPNRLSYFLNLNGPSEPIETACSSSLVAIHRAVAAMQAGACGMAIVGGVNTMITPEAHISFSKAGMLSKDGHCKSFSDQANGYVRGEGVGILVLKKLRIAEADGDHIYGVIKGSAENHGGRAASLTAPNPKAQSDLLKAVYSKAGIDPATVGYIEAHGTGTELGDPIEVDAIKSSFNELSLASSSLGTRAHCGLGSIKTNIGHLELAAGVAGVIKVLLQIKHATLVKSLHCETVNPYIQLENSPFYIVRENCNWEALKDKNGQDLPRRAGVSSFGFGGVNAHIVIEEYIEKVHRGTSKARGREKYLIVLSAKDEELLKTNAEQLLGFLKRDSKGLLNLEDLAYTLQVGRDAMEHRLAMTVRSIAELKQKLELCTKGLGTINKSGSGEIYQGKTKGSDNAFSLFTEDEDLFIAMDSWLAKGKYNKLLRLWVKGMEFDWNKLYNSHTPKRMSLPTYPFTRQSYWVPDVQTRSIKQPEGKVEVETISQRVSPLMEKTLDLLKALFEKICKLPADTIDTEANLEEYGIDSLVINRLNQQMAGFFQEMPKTLFFEYQTLSELVEYLVSDYPEECMKWCGLGASDSLASGPEPSSIEPKQEVWKRKSERGDREPIAIIGMSGRYPQARTINEYWENLSAGKDCISAIPEERWPLDGFFHPEPEEALAQGKSYCRHGGFLQGFAGFDPLFFNISPREALNMDPQERLFLMECWHVVEDAGYTKERLHAQHNGQVGVFAGITKTGFELYGPGLWEKGQRLHPRTSFSSVANRISFMLDLQGPSMPIDTMCSSSLTAIHEACEHLQREECEMAIAGGVNLYLHPSSFVELCNHQMLATDGQCRSFGEGGNGFVPGEGVGVLLLKPLSSAKADNDQIHAIIRGSSINHGGKTNGYTVPNPRAQARLIRKALENAGTHSREVSYIEAHGTGTELGDPIEIRGLSRVFQEDSEDTGFCAIGSVKSNIGHLEAAAGIAGVMKIILQMKHGKLVPSLHAKKANPNIKFTKTPFVIQQELGPWERPAIQINGQTKQYPRIAGISSFGAAGANAHVVLQEYVEQDEGRRPMAKDGEAHLIALSAKSEDRLREMATNLYQYILEHTNSNLTDISYTLQVGREAMEERLAFIVCSLTELKEKLTGFIDDHEDVDLYRSQVALKNNALDVFVKDEDTNDLLDKWIQKRKFKKLAKLWVKGFDIKWGLLYGPNPAAPEMFMTPKVASLPTYPFENEHYWFQDRETGRGSISTIAEMKDAHEHLWGENISTLRQWKYKKIFSGKEHYLEDHIVKGKKTLPGVAYLEWARSVGELLYEKVVTKIDDIVWITPISMENKPLESQIALFPEENHVVYKVTTKDNGGKEIIHAQGRLHYAGTDLTKEVCPPGLLDFNGIRQRCTKQEGRDHIYERIRKGSVTHGKSLSVIEEISRNDHEVLAKIVLSKEQQRNLDKYVLDPGIMDGALQSATCLINENTSQPAPHLPFGVDEILIYKPLKPVCWVYVTRIENQNSDSSDTKKFNILIVDESGTLLLNIQGFSMRKFIDDPVGTECEKFESGLPKIQLQSLDPMCETSTKKRRCLGLLSRNAQSNITPIGLYPKGGMKNSGVAGLGEYTLGLQQPPERQFVNERVLEEIMVKGRNENFANEKQVTVPVELVDELRVMLAETLYLDLEKITANKHMVELGIDSILGVEFIQQINRKYGISLKATSVYEHPTLEKFGQFILANNDIEAACQPTIPCVEELSGSGPCSPQITANQSKPVKKGDIAVIGVSCRFAQTKGVEEFWHHVDKGRYLITDIPKQRFDVAPLYSPDPSDIGKIYCNKGSFIDDIDLFDPLFFKITPREAESLDPQVRLLMEVIWETVEDAGYAGSIEGSNTGMFVGNCFTHYHSLLLEQSNPDYQYILMGNGNSILSNRISYCFDLKGPSLTLDTACASSLVALHLACQSLRNNEADQALVGGVSLNLDPGKYLTLCAGGALSKSGNLSPFDEEADGFIPGEGVAAVLLKPLDQAQKDGDHIYGVIKGTSVKHGGYSGGPTVPNVEQETQVMLNAWKDADIHPETLTYYESHGTGTKLGDPLEMNAFQKAMSLHTDKTSFCAVGTVKANIGHTEETAGLAGLINVLMMMKHKTIPVLPRLKTKNSLLELESSPLFIPTEKMKWVPEEHVPRRAGISAFGLTGTLAHVVVEEPQGLQRRDEGAAPYLVILSAQNEERLFESIVNLYQVLQVSETISLADLAYTLQVGRKPMAERVVFVVRDMDELLEKLHRYEKGEREIAGVYLGNTKVSEDASASLTKIESDDESKRIIDEHDDNKLAQGWVHGMDIDWNLLYQGQNRQRIPLPTYPFAKERYWISEDIVQGPARTSADSSEESVLSSEVLLLQPCWKEKNVAPDASSVDYAQHIIIQCQPGIVSEQGIAPLLQEIRLITVEPGKIKKQTIAEKFLECATRVFEVLQGVCQDRARGKLLVQVLIAGQGEERFFSGLAAMLKTARLENPKIIGQLIHVDGYENQDEKISEIIQSSSRCVDETLIRYKNGKRWVGSIEEIKCSELLADIPWKDKGVYLITGGAGGLGLIFAREIALKVKDPVLILTGRSELNQDKKAALPEIESLGARVTYKQIDVTKKSAVSSLIKNITKENKGLDGIIHSAGVISDNFILKKTKKEFQQVLAPKVSGLLNIDLASKDLELDFFILFSSIASIIGNIGQADYSAANGFMDAYADYRNKLVRSKQRYGKTLSVDWPLWQDGGMSIDVETQKMVSKSLGAEPMETATGIMALYQAFSWGRQQVAVLAGDLPRIRKQLFDSASTNQSRQPHPTILHRDLKNLKKSTLHLLKVLFSKNTKLDLDRVDPLEPLENYGIDSIMITRLNQELAPIFDDLPKTLFYEHRTLQELAQYLSSEHPQACMKWDGKTDQDMQTINLVSQPSQRKTVFPKAYERVVREPIAIIGMSGRFPKANTIDAYWQNLKAGKDCISEVPEDRWSLANYFQQDPDGIQENGQSYCRQGGFVEGFADFDPKFFNISPREVINIDPQERLFLQECWRAFEDAGYSRQRLKLQHNGRVGVYAGITKTGFDLYGPDLWKEGKRVHPRTSFSSVANRISYLMNIQGPSMPIDTMCSSSLTAIHEACEHLLRGECEMAIAGGVNIYLHPSSFVELFSQGMLSPEGQCKSFGKDANGFVPGEGVGMVVLKPLSRAQADHDHIYALIRGSSINHDGKTNGYTVPNPIAQGELIRHALDKAGVSAREVSYIEAHGTGTQLGDPIEIRGLGQAFGHDTEDTGFCAIGSVKSNIGHLEAAAGIAGVMKIVLQMNAQTLVPSLHADQPNPNINFDKTPFVVQQELSRWKRPVVKIRGKATKCSRIAGVSSFGAGGANAHVVIEEYDKGKIRRPEEKESREHLIVLSAKDDERLREIVTNLYQFIQQPSSFNLTDLAYTLQVGREAMEQRLAIIIDSVKELEEKLESFLEGKTPIGMYRGQLLSDKSAFIDDEEIQETLDKWIEGENHKKLMEFWVKGLEFDWNRLYGGSTPCCISLPTYPFVKKRYWLTEAEKFHEPVSREVNSQILPEYEQASSGMKIVLSELQPRSNASAFDKGQKQMPDLTLQPISDNTQSVENNPSTCDTVTAESLQKELTISLAKSLFMEIDEINGDAKFVDLGMDSIVAVEWMRMVNTSYKTSIPATIVYDYPTTYDFAEYLAKELNKKNEKSEAAFIEPSSELSPELALDELLQNVQQGGLNIEEADILFNNIRN